MHLPTFRFWFGIQENTLPTGQDCVMIIFSQEMESDSSCSTQLESQIA